MTDLERVQRAFRMLAERMPGGENWHLLMAIVKQLQVEIDLKREVADEHLHTNAG